MCDQDLTHSLDTLKCIFVNIVSKAVIRDACGTWRSLCTVTTIQSIQKSTRNSPLETRKQISQWIAEDTVLAFYSPSCQCFWTDCWKFFRGGFKTSYWGSLWPRSDLFLGHTKNISVNIFLKVYIRDMCGTWHGLFTVASIHSILKNTRNSQKLENGLWNKLAGWWRIIQESKQREIELISKKVWRKRNEKMFKRSNLLVLCEEI